VGNITGEILFSQEISFHAATGITSPDSPTISHTYYATLEGMNRGLIWVPTQNFFEVTR
jgi:hypothetical protein